MWPLLLHSGSPGGPKGNGCNQREARNNKVRGKLGQLARCQEVSFSSDVPREPASKHQNRGDENLSALDERGMMATVGICFPDHDAGTRSRRKAKTCMAISATVQRQRRRKPCR